MKDIFLRNFLIFLFLMYLAQGILYPSGVLSQIIVLVIVAICLYYCALTFLLRVRKNRIVKLWTLLFFINIIYAFFTADFSSTLHFETVKGVILTSVSFYPFYYFGLKGVKLKKVFIVFFIAALPIAIFHFFSLRDQIIFESLNDLQETQVVNNATYLLAMLIPYGLFIKNKTLAGTLMLISFYFIILGVKRETAIAGVVTLIVFAYVNVKNAKGLFSNLLIVVTTLVLLSYAIDFVMENDYLVERFTSSIESKDSSGRDEIVENIITYWSMEGNTLNLIFGYGFAATLVGSQINSFAHNDWVEILCNYGLLGVVVYVLLFYSLIKMALKSRDKEIFLLVLLLVVIRTIFSMFYTSIESFVLVMIIGAFVGKKLDTEFK